MSGPSIMVGIIVAPHGPQIAPSWAPIQVVAGRPVRLAGLAKGRLAADSPGGVGGSLIETVVVSCVYRWLIVLPTLRPPGRLLRAVL